MLQVGPQKHYDKFSKENSLLLRSKKSIGMTLFAHWNANEAQGMGEPWNTSDTQRLPAEGVAIEHSNYTIAL
jgi:hypothetical protein